MTAAPTETTRKNAQRKGLSRSRYNTYVWRDMYEFLRGGETSTRTAHVYGFYVCVGSVPYCTKVGKLLRPVPNKPRKLKTLRAIRNDVK